jgi:hypothetical protein
VERLLWAGAFALRRVEERDEEAVPMAERSRDPFMRGFRCALLAVLDATGEAPDGRKAEGAVAVAARAAEGRLRVRAALRDLGCHPRGGAAPAGRRAVVCAGAPSSVRVRPV